MKKFVLWGLVCISAILLTIGVKAFIPFLDEKAAEMTMPINEKRRAVVLTHYLANDLAKLEIGKDQQYWGAFAIYDDLKDFPWVKGKILNQSGFGVGAVTFIYNFKDMSLNPNSVRVLLQIYPQHLEEVARSDGALGEFVSSKTNNSGSSIASEETFEPSGNFRSEFNYSLDDEPVEVEIQAVANYFNYVFPTLIESGRYELGQRVTDYLTEASFEVTGDGNFDHNRRYIFVLEPPFPQFMGHLRPGSDGRFEFGFRPILKEYSPEKALKYWQSLKVENVIYALELYRDNDPGGVLRFDPESGEMITDIHPDHFVGR